jgi:tRNA uridine 5-carboxymethylaminomethyl modification enzyme
VFAEEAGDDRPVAFSFMTDQPLRNQIRCWLLYTNDAVRELVRGTSTAARCSTARFAGSVRGIARRSKTRSCGFPDRERHQIYLEPEGLDVDEIYVNGFR